MTNNIEDVADGTIDFVDFVTSDEEKFATSMRGKYIIAQALHYGIEALNKVPLPYREASNIQDMEYLMRNIGKMLKRIITKMIIEVNLMLM